MMLTRNRERLITTDKSRKVMTATLTHREVAPWLSDQHLSVDSALIKAFAMGLEPMATPWLIIHPGLPVEDGRRTT